MFAGVAFCRPGRLRARIALASSNWKKRRAANDPTGGKR
jgi:hypothetical protein